MLELGAGFHPELTGRENVMLNGTLLGHTCRELEARMDAIIEFAELGGFIEAPLADILERHGGAARLRRRHCLAAGDPAWWTRCWQSATRPSGGSASARMQTFRDEGTTILMVTHDMSTVTDYAAAPPGSSTGRSA